MSRLKRNPCFQRGKLSSRCQPRHRFARFHNALFGCAKLNFLGKTVRGLIAAIEPPQRFIPRGAHPSSPRLTTTMLRVAVHNRKPAGRPRLQQVFAVVVAAVVCL
jgi:hypothetical protein